MYLMINIDNYIKLTTVLIFHPDDGNVLDKTTFAPLKDAVKSTPFVEPISVVVTSVN
jgi:hypothetical protein